jgi:N-ethylmaleimide reductase
MPSLFDAYTLGTAHIHNRIALAPMTRSRATNDDLAVDANTALYYAQRASGGLLITEGTPISIEGRGQVFTPGIYSDKQIAGWKAVTEAVHAKNGTIFAQLWHVGRASHTSIQANHQPPVSSVAVQANNAITFAYDDQGKVAPLPQSRPRALTVEDIARIVGEYVQSAKNAIAAGFDGVEIHSANGYLLDQFINGALNTRTDAYGGASAENRIRFTLEVIDAILAAVGDFPVGVRFSPFGRFNDVNAYEGEEATWLLLAKALSSRKLAYVHLNNQNYPDSVKPYEALIPKFRAAYSGTLILAGGFTNVTAQQALDNNLADIIAFGTPYIGNPDLVERFKNNWPLAESIRDTFYQGGAKGYTDYPTYQP